MKISLLKILVALSTILMIVVNYAAVTGAIGGTTPKEVSDRYPTFLTPAPYAFSIWTLIYLGLIAFSIYQFTVSGNVLVSRIRSAYVYSCIANIGWIFAWHDKSIFLSTIAIFALLGLLFTINRLCMPLTGSGVNLFIRIPFSIYFGWITAAATVNLAVFFVSLNIKIETPILIFVSAIIVFLIAGIGITLRHSLHIPFYAIAIAWALTAIAVKQSGKTIIVVACGIGVIALLFSAMTEFLRGARR